MLELQSETDVLVMGSVNARQPDHDRFRLWEVAGSSHAETYLLVASRTHTDDTTIEELGDDSTAAAVTGSGIATAATAVPGATMLAPQGALIKRLLTVPGVRTIVLSS